METCEIHHVGWSCFLHKFAVAIEITVCGRGLPYWFFGKVVMDSLAFYIRFLNAPCIKTITLIALSPLFALWPFPSHFPINTGPPFSSQWCSSSLPFSLLWWENSLPFLLSLLPVLLTDSLATFICLLDFRIPYHPLAPSLCFYSFDGKDGPLSLQRVGEADSRVLISACGQLSPPLTPVWA